MSFDEAVIIIVGVIIACTVLILQKINKLLSQLNITKPSDEVFKAPANALSSGGVPLECDVTEDVVAAVTAAIAFVGETDLVNYQIKEINPSSTQDNNVPIGGKPYKRPVWMQAGILDNTRQFHG